MVSLDSGVAFITGAGSGIGRAMAEEFGESGASVAVADVDTDGAEETVRNVTDAGGEAIAVEVDVTSQESIAAGVERTVDEFGTINILCNNAGITDEFRPVLDTSEEFWERVMSVNLAGVFRVTREALPVMLDDDGGAVVNTASVAGKIAGGAGIAYTTAKHGVVGFTKQLSFEYGPDIRANAVCPGLIETPLTADAIEDMPEHYRTVIETSPAGRHAQPEEVASVVAFLASDGASYMHGTAVDVDGGWLIS